MQPRILNRILLITVLPMLIAACGNHHSKPLQTLSLSSNWEFSGSRKNQWFPATVPGTVHTDLFNNGLIPDPFSGTNEDSLQWIEKEDWIYRCSFEASEVLLSASEAELVFEGLDTYADVYLNDSLIIRADNMFISWEASCAELLKMGTNSIRIHFHSPVNIGLEKLKALGYPLIATNEQAPEGQKTNVFTRKAPFHYGWDWGPRLVTSGIWRPVSIRAWSNARIAGIQLIQKEVRPELAIYEATTEVISSKEGNCLLEVFIDGKRAIKKSTSLKRGSNTVPLDIRIDKPELWWTNGLGGQKLYNLEIVLTSKGSPLDRYNLDLGVRTLELVQEPDEKGRSFYFRLNGVPVFMKGSNYIPGDIFTPSVTPEKYQRVIQEAKDANMNMLRVWGGAIYENDYFYDLCDRNGILVWQDFMFACALQPGDSLHLDNIRKEAEYNVKRLRNHPCMALWCGNNENLIAWHNWGWQNRYTKEQNTFLWETYDKIFHHILADAVKKYHPELSYWPSSPQSYGNQLPDRLSGDEHDWSIWFGQREYREYGVNTGRFVSEYGLQSFPELSTLKSFAEEKDLYRFSPVLERRQRSKMEWVKPGYNGNHMQEWYIRKYFPEPKDFESFVYLSQVNHQLNMEEAIEAHRRNMPWCMGSLYWQINDCWPTISWSSVDYFGNWKAPHYQAKRSFEKIILATEHKTDSVAIFVVSDELTPRKVLLQLSWMDRNGKSFGESLEKEIQIGANTSSKVFSTLNPGKLYNRPGKTDYLVARIVDGDSLLCEKLISFGFPKEEKPGIPVFTKRLEKISEGLILRLSCDKPARYVQLQSSISGLKWSDNYFDLLPGTEKTILIKGPWTDEKDFSESLRIRCLNELL